MVVVPPGPVLWWPCNATVQPESAIERAVIAILVTEASITQHFRTCGRPANYFFLGAVMSARLLSSASTLDFSTT